MKKASTVSKWSMVAVVILTIPSWSWAQETSPYSFSGPCASQGQWTRAALNHTNEVKQIITRLKDNPACNALKTTIQGGLEGVDNFLGEIDKSYNENNAPGLANLSKLPTEISSLRSFSRENSLFRNNVVELLMGKTVQLSALSSQRVNGNAIDPQDMANNLSTLQQRNHRATMAGLGLFNSTMGALQEAQANCLDGTDGATAIAGMVKILSSFASSGDQGMNSQMAMAVQNLGQYLGRDKKYISALRKLNDREFISSMSCLMEVTTDGYCSTLDAQYMFQEVASSQTIKVQEVQNQRTGLTEKRIVGVSKNFTQKLQEGPLAGYYILTRQVPVVTEWIQKVQYGITPQLPTEADFQIGVSTNVYEHYNTLKKIEGTFNYQKKLMAELTDFKAKQTYALSMLTNVADAMTGGRGMRGNDSENFFSKVSTQNEIYFRLLGIPVPEAVLGKGPEGIQFSGQPERWLNAQYRAHPLFNDPDKLADTMYDNMQVLFKESTAIAIAYYNKYFIVDKVQVVNDSLLGLDVNVRDALVNIDRYLENLERRIEQDSKDPTMIASILDTRSRIGRILRRYKDLRDYSMSLLQYQKQNNGKNMDSDEMAQKLRKVGDALLQQVYTEFEILTARTGFLSKRMAGFVFQDYTLSLRNRNEFNQYFDDLMLATGYNSLNTMMNMSQTEFSKVKTDLDSAMNIYKTNIDALEPIATGVFMRNIFDLKLKASGKEITDVERTQMIYALESKLGSAQIPGEESNAVQRGVRGALNRLWMDLTFEDSEQLGAPGFFGKLALPFKQAGNWALGRKGKIVSSPVSEFDSAENEMAKLCVQTLAFANLRPYWELCREAMLASPMMNNPQNMSDSEVKKVIEDYLSVKYINKAYENIEPNKIDITAKDRARNYQSRICALRDYFRRNEVARVTSSMRTDGDTYETEFTKEIKEALPVVNPVAQPAVAPGTSTKGKSAQNADSDDSF